ncbi:hypothetical protein D3C71_273230 [compost metagenome]
MAETDDDFLGFHAAADVGLGFVGRFVALLHFEGDLVGAAVLGAAQRADGARDGREHVRTGAGDDARGEGGRVEFVFSVQVQGDVHRLDPFVAGLLAVQQMQEVATDAVVVGLHVDDAAVVAEVVPVQQGGTQVGHQAVGDVARARGVVVVFFRQHAAQYGHGRAHHVHRVAGGGQGFQCNLQLRGQAAQAAQLFLVGLQFGLVGQLAMDQQVGDFLELAGVGDVQDVVAAVVQVVAAAADRAQRGVARDHAGQRDRLLGLEAGFFFRLGVRRGCLLLGSRAHVSTPFLLRWTMQWVAGGAPGSAWRLMPGQ